MHFSTGQIVVHPHHGPATVTGTSTRTLRGAPIRYLDLAVHHRELTIAVPVGSADEVGLRPVLGPAELDRLLDVLRAPTVHEEQGWSRRFKDNQEKLRTGDLAATAVVVRDLTRRQDEHGLSWGEKDLLKHAREPLVTEIALSLGRPDEDASGLLDDAIRHREASRAPVLAAAG